MYVRFENRWYSHSRILMNERFQSREEKGKRGRTSSRLPMPMSMNYPRAHMIGLLDDGVHTLARSLSRATYDHLDTEAGAVKLQLQRWAIGKVFAAESTTIGTYYLDYARHNDRSAVESSRGAIILCMSTCENAARLFRANGCATCMTGAPEDAFVPFGFA